MPGRNFWTSARSHKTMCETLDVTPPSSVGDMTSSPKTCKDVQHRSPKPPSPDEMAASGALAKSRTQPYKNRPQSLSWWPAWRPLQAQPCLNLHPGGPRPRTAPLDVGPPSGSRRPGRQSLAFALKRMMRGAALCSARSVELSGISCESQGDSLLPSANSDLSAASAAR